MRSHYVAYYTACENVGQHTLHAISRAYHGLTVVLGYKHEHSVVIVLLAYTPLRKQLGSKFVGIAVDRVHGHHHNLRRGVTPQP